MNNVRVLCVENQKEYLDALKYMLETAGYEVLSATTGSQGLSILMKQPIHGVLLEYDLSLIHIYTGILNPSRRSSRRVSRPPIRGSMMSKRIRSKL